MVDIFDYEDDVLDEGSVNDDSGLAALSALVTKASQVDIEVARAEDQLKKLKETQVELKQKRIPDLMDELDTASHTTKSGLKVTVKNKVRARITDATRDAAVQWFKDQNLEAMVKNEFKLALDKNQGAAAKALIKAIKKIGLAFSNKKNVNPATLSAFVKQRDAAGEEVPDDLFNVFRYSEAKIG